MRGQLLEELQRDPERFGFYELVRLLEFALSSDVGAPDGGERIRFAHSPDLGFPAFDVAWLRIKDRIAQVGTTFLGLLGTASPLSPEWTEQVLHEDDDGDLREFYDAFHHRTLALLYATWKEHALEGGFDLSGRDSLSRRLRSLAGIDGWRDSRQDALPPMTALGLADYQRGQPQTIDVSSAEGLLRRLYPDWNVRLEGGVPRFVRFSERERVRLGESRSRLGHTLVYGDGCEEAESLLRVIIGPVDRATYEGLMPGGQEYLTLWRLTQRLFAGTLDLELEVEIGAQDAPTCVLGRRAGGARLGIDSRVSDDHAAPVRVRVRLQQDAAAARRQFLQGQT